MILNNSSWIHKNISSPKKQQTLNEARGKKIADPLRAKLMGMEDIRALKGTMTPRYFATKVIRFLQKNHPELDISSLSDDDIQQAINVVAQVSKPLVQKPDVKITTRKRGAAEGGLQRGDTGFETLKLNLGDNAVLKSEGEVGENDLYTVVKDGLKYRVTLNKFKGQKLNLDDISQDDVVSVVVVKPSEMETVDKFAGEVELGQREKLVADYPEGEEENTDRYGRKHGISQERDLEDYELEDRRMRMQFPVDPDEEIGPEDAEEDIDAASGAMKGIIAKKRLNYIDNIMSTYEGKSLDFYKKAFNKSPYFKDGKLTPYELFTIEREMKRHEDAEDCPYSDEEKAEKDYDKDGKIESPGQEYKGARDRAIKNAMENERKRAGRAHSRAVADHYEDMHEEDEQVAMSSRQINQHMINQYRQNLQRQYGHERRNRHGY